MIKGGLPKNVRVVRERPGFMDTIDLNQWENSYAQGIDYRGYMPSIIMGSSGFVEAYRRSIRRHMQQIELRHLNRARLMFESDPGPHDWYQQRTRLWFCELNGVRFAVVDDNPDTALFSVDEASRERC